MASEEEHVCETEENQTSTKLKTQKHTEQGIIYLSRIPMMMNVTTIRSIFSRHGEIGRIFLQPNLKARSRGKKVRSFSEGWVEFENKKKAKKVAVSLNNQQIGGRRKNPWFEEIWNIKYLAKFRWAHLNERLAYEKAVHEQRMRTEISQVKREAEFHKKNFDDSRKLHDIAERKRKKGETFEIQDFTFKLRDTEDEILAKKAKMRDGKMSKPKKKCDKFGVHSAGANKAFLASLFSGGVKKQDSGQDDDE